MREDYWFLDRNGERVFAGLHHPSSPATRAIIMCHPLGEEKLWAHRVFVSFARELAAAGFAVLRFDFRGEGDSDREFEQADFESRIQDTCLAIDTVRKLFPAVTEVTLLGLRLGASVAAATAARRNDVSRLVLWDPVIDGSGYMQAVLRLNLMFQMALHHKVVERREALVARLECGETVNIEGYELTAPLFLQVSSFQLSNALSTFDGATLIVQINPVDAPLKQELKALAALDARIRVEAVVEEPFWKEIKTFYQRAPELTRVTSHALELTR